MTTAAPERIPTPLAVDASVTADIASRTLAVRLADAASGYERHLWREAHAALSREEDRGWYGSSATVWCSSPSQRNIVSATAGDFQMLLARFRPGESAFTELVGRPRLYAIVVIDSRAGPVFERQLSQPSGVAA